MSAEMANIVKEKEALSSHGGTHMTRRGEDLTYDGSGRLNIDNHATEQGEGLADDETEGRKKDEDMTGRREGLTYGRMEGRDNTSQERGKRSAEDFQRKRRWSRRDHCESSNATSSEDEQANRTRRRGMSCTHGKKKRWHQSSSNFGDDRPQPSKGKSRKYGYGIRHVQMMCMCGCMIALFMARGSLGVAILAMTDSSRRNDSNVEIYEWDKKTQGLILSSFFWGYMAMQIPAGLLAKKYGGKLILLVALLVNGLISLILPLVASLGGWPCVCVCRVVMGLTQACLFPASHTLLGRWLPASERTALSGLVYGGGPIGTIIGMPLSGLLSETALGWKTIFYTISGLMFLTAGMWYWFTASSPEEHTLISAAEREYILKELNATPSKRATPWRHLFRTVPLWAIMASHVGATVAFTLFFVDLPTYLELAMEISLKNSAILSGMPYVGMWLGNILSTHICEKIFNKGLLSMVVCRKIFNSIAMFGTACGLVVLAFLHPEDRMLAVCTLIVTLAMYGFNSAGFMVNHLDLSPQFAGVMLSLTNFGGSLSSIFTPIATSLILRNDPSDISRWRIVFLITAAILVLCNIVYLIFGSTSRQLWDSPDYDDKLKADIEEIQPVLYKNQEKDKEANNHSV